MTECRECERSIPESANFCPSCGAPQNEEAARALESFTKKRLAELSPEEREELLAEDGDTLDRSDLANRLSYAVGWLTIVVGLATLPSLASAFLLFAGIIILPPIRRLIGRVVGTEPDLVPIVAVYTLSVSLAAAFVWVF
jgi:hypothetical protein